LDLPGLETSKLEEIFTTAAGKQKPKPMLDLDFTSDSKEIPIVKHSPPTVSNEQEF
jgi:hypothetical protein